MAKQTQTQTQENGEPDITGIVDAYLADGFRRVNPPPRFWNLDGASPLVGVVLSRDTLSGKQGISNPYHYQFLVFEAAENGYFHDKDGNRTQINPKTGEIVDRAILPGTIMRVGERSQLEVLERYTGKATKVILIPKSKVKTSSGNEVWQIEVLARPLHQPERRFVEQHVIGHTWL